MTPAEFDKLTAFEKAFLEELRKMRVALESIAKQAEE